MSTPAPLILLTGATGHIGFRALLHALSSSSPTYRVRAAVRSPAKATTLLAHPSIVRLTLEPDVLTFVTVPDILAPDAYDEALKDVTYVVHIASPLASNKKTPIDYDAELIQPAVQGTLGLLRSAKGVESVRKVVITSSMAAVVQLGDNNEGKVFTADNILPDNPGPYTSPFEAYAASKRAALNASRAFVKRENPSFDIINIMPSFVVGRNELITNPADVALGSNRVVMTQLLGHPAPTPVAGGMVHIDDVAKVHILALDHSKVRGKFLNFGANCRFVTHNTQYADAIEIATRRFPEAVRGGLLNVGAGGTKTTVLDFNAGWTEEVLGIKFRGFEEQVVDVVGYYLELVEKEVEGN